MKKLFNILLISICSLFFTQCSDYLDTSSPSSTNDEFVSSSPEETLKLLSRAYGLFREGCGGSYDWNDHFCSDTEYYPEANSNNNANAKLVPENVSCNYGEGPFNNLYTVISYCKKISELIDTKTTYQEDIATGRTSDWTQLKGEAETLRATCYFSLLRHYGDVPYGYEGAYTDHYELSSRFDIYDKIIEALKTVEPYMYTVGEAGLTAERMTRTYANALIGQMALYAGSYQTIRTDIPELYGNVQFQVVSTDNERKCAYARRTDYKNYYILAEEYFQKALSTAAGTTKMVTMDERSYANNPFQRHFQYGMDLELSPEAIYEIGLLQGPEIDSRMYTYDFGRGCNGGNNTAPNKVFGAIRMIPTFYYGGYANDDKRRDVSATVTGLDGKGNELPFTFKAGAKTDGGICLNKWDICRQNPYYVGPQRKAGFNVPIMRVTDIMLLQAEVKAELGADIDAMNLVNQIRERAFGDTQHNLSGLSGDALKEAILMERKYELFGEGYARYDLLRSGKFAEKAIAVQEEMKVMATDIKIKGYHRFANGNEMPAYIWIKQMEGAKLTYDCTDENDPISFPGWRGINDYTGLNVTVTGTAHNTAIKGIFRYIDPDSEEAKQLENDGYTKKEWGIQLADNIDIYISNILSGITSEESVPCYLWPIPSETISQSKGMVTNGYGLPQQ